MKLRRAEALNTQGLWITADHRFCFTLLEGDDKKWKRGWIVTVHYGTGGPRYKTRAELRDMLNQHGLGLAGSAFATRREAMERLADALILEQEALA